MATAVKRQHEPQSIIDDLLTAEISEKQARSIKYQLTSRSPKISTIFGSKAPRSTKTLVNDLARGGFIAERAMSCWSAARVPGTHITSAIARSYIRDRARGWFYNVVKLSIGSRPRPATAGSPSIRPGWTSSSSMSWFTFRLRNPARQQPMASHARRSLVLNASLRCATAFRLAASVTTCFPKAP